MKTKEKGEAEAVGRLVIDRLLPLNAEQRTDALAMLRDVFCVECGNQRPLHGTCQCWNDE